MRLIRQTLCVFRKCLRFPKLSEYLIGGSYVSQSLLNMLSFDSAAGSSLGQYEANSVFWLDAIFNEVEEMFIGCCSSNLSGFNNLFTME